MKTRYFSILAQAIRQCETGYDVDTMCNMLHDEYKSISINLMNSQIVYSAIGMRDAKARKVFTQIQLDGRMRMKAIQKALTMMPSTHRPSKIKPHHFSYSYA
jgi:hypothetical protein